MKKRITLRNSQERNDLKGDSVIPLSTETGGYHNLFSITSHLVRYRRFISYTVMVVCTLATLWVLLTPNRYVSVSSILPSGQVDQMSRLKSLAGLSVSAGAGENSSELFPVILRSQTIREAVLAEKYSFTHNGKDMSMTLYEYFDQDDPDLARIKLKNITSVSIGKKTGVITLTVETENAELSQTISGEYLKQLEQYNLHNRKSLAGENADYLGDQIELTRVELEQAEDRLQEFQQANSDWAGSSDPETIKMLSRLQREVTVKSQTYLYLMQEYEVTKFDAKKDVPIVRILDYPSRPTIKAGPHRKFIVILTVFLTLIGATMLSFAHRAVTRSAQETDRDSYDSMRRDISQAFPRSEKTINRLRNRLGRKESTVIQG